MVQYVRVSENENEEPIELPVEDDKTLLLSTLRAQFADASGLKYRSRSTNGVVRGIRLSDDRLHAPELGWGSITYFCVFPKEVKRRLRDSDDEQSENRKRLEKTKCSDLIILNIPFTTTEAVLRDYLESQGETLMVQLKTDPVTGYSKGYGFVRFKNYDDQKKILSKRHMIDGRWCEFRIPNSCDPATERLPFKLFVGRVTEKLSNNDIQEYFSKYGEITEVFRPTPFRGFVFVSFVCADVVDHLCGEDHFIKGVSVFVSNASPKSKRSISLSGPMNGGSMYPGPNKYYDDSYYGNRSGYNGSYSGGYNNHGGSNYNDGSARYYGGGFGMDTGNRSGRSVGGGGGGGRYGTNYRGY